MKKSLKRKAASTFHANEEKDRCTRWQEKVVVKKDVAVAAPAPFRGKSSARRSHHN